MHELFSHFQTTFKHDFECFETKCFDYYLLFSCPSLLIKCQQLLVFACPNNSPPPTPIHMHEPRHKVLVAHVIDGLIRGSSCKCDQVD